MTAISVLFSGGPDSTLAAVYALQKASQVHLLTYHHQLMTHYRTTSGEEKQMKVANELSRIYGANRVIVSGGQISQLFREIYRNPIMYRGYYIPWLCGACKLAMHIKTIEYNLRNKITITYDGANKESASIFPAQSLPYMAIIKKIYELYDMNYENPVYDLEGTDALTEDFGLRSCHATKREHFLFSTQHSCFLGVLVHLHARFYRLFYGRNKIDNFHGTALESKINELQKFLPER